MKRNQETGNRQTKYCNPRAHARRALINVMLVDINTPYSMSSTVASVLNEGSVLSAKQFAVEILIIAPGTLYIIKRHLQCTVYTD